LGQGLDSLGRPAHDRQMFTEAQDSSPVTGADGDGPVEVDLAADHPGVADPAYRTRRNAIAALAVGHRRGEPVPHADYSPEEHAVWTLVSRELAAQHATYAVREYRDAVQAVALPTDHIPQLDEVSARVEPLTGFRYEPVAGLATLREFYGAMAAGVFLSTQYIRHHSVPLYTPEPDVVHEVIGHAHTLADPGLASVYRAAGAAAQRVQTDEALEFLSKVFWFSLEFGVAWEAGELRTYGAGLLSSYGEIQEFRAADVRPLDLAAMGTQSYDITHYQPVLFAGRSLSHVVDVVGGFFEAVDDETPARLLARAA